MIAWHRIGGALAGLLVTGTLLSVPIGSAGAATGFVRVGSAPRPSPGTVRLSALSGKADLRVDVTLQPRNPEALASYARAVSTPGSGLYRHYLAPGQFVSEFGPTQQAIQSVEQSLRSAGLHPGAISGNHLAIPVRATAGQLSSAFSTGFQQYEVGSGRIAYANTAAPLVATSAAPYVQGVVGLDDLNVPISAPRESTRTRSAAPRPESNLGAQGGPQPCTTATDDAEVEGAVTLDQLATAYGFTGPYSSDDLGAGQTVAVYELAGYSPSDIAAFQSCYGTDTSITTVDTDGGPGRTTGTGVGEADGDMEIVLSLAPKVNILDYQAPDTGAGSYDNYNAIISQDAAKVISTSWLLCEQFTSGYQAENTLFEEAAAQGQTILAATGDYGSEGCAQVQKRDTSLAVDDPASQPFVTGVGGTTVSSIGPQPSETTWNDGLDTFGSSGGGISADWPMPSYQLDAPAAVGVINANSSGTPCGATDCREVPDVSADAGGGDSWYLLYIDGGWQDWGGTSFATPLWAALVALSNASSACDGQTVGFANPALYSIAGTDYAGAFHDITVGNNDYSQTNGGLYPALVGYDMATGLGSPNGTVLPTALCAAGTVDPVTVTDPGTQTSSVGQSTSLQITARDATVGQTLSYSALSLPAGLSIDGSTGLITGQPTTPGVSSVAVTARDGNGASDTTTFQWFVPPSITGVKPAYGSASGATKVSITGVGFVGATSVRFGASPATSFTVNRPGTKITAYSPSGSGTVALTVTGPSGTSQAAVFAYGPAITGVSPTSGAPGKKVTIKGTDLSGATVTFAPGVSAVVVSSSATKISVDVPSGAVTGPISVATPGGTATSSTFDVT